VTDWIVGSGAIICDEGRMKLLCIVYISQVVFRQNIGFALFDEEPVMQMLEQEAQRDW